MKWLVRSFLCLGLIATGAIFQPTLVALAAEADVYWLGGTSSTGAPIFIPVSSVNPLPTACH